MQIVWLGQGGLMLVSQRHKLLIDPYMTNELKKIDKKFRRRIGIKKKYFKLKPDLILLTNSNPDHTDEKTLAKFIKKHKSKKNRLPILCCERTYNALHHNKEYKKANHIMFGTGDEWTFKNMHILAVRASTADRSAFGVIITDLLDGKKYYIASNTLYNEEIISSLPSDIYVAFIPISGTYGCMNRVDAQRFATRIDSTYVVPINYGMFDNVNPQEFICQGRVIPKPFKAIFFDPNNARPPKKRVLDRRFNEKPRQKAKPQAPKFKASKSENVEAKDKNAIVKDENAATIVIEQ